MIGVKDFVAAVNLNIDAFLAGREDFTGYKIYGIGTNAIKQGTQNQVYPAIFSKDGNGTYIGAEDIYSVIVYHKLLALRTTIITANGYGDSRGDIRNTYSMQAVIFLNRFRTQVEPDELFLMLQSIFPTIENFTNFKSVLYNIVDAILNSQQVFNNEYKNVQYFVKPEHALMAIDYTIESTFKRECFNVILKS